MKHSPFDVETWALGVVRRELIAKHGKTLLNIVKHYETLVNIVIHCEPQVKYRELIVKHH